MKQEMNIPNDIQDILQTLWNHGAEAFLVGGCVRDMLMHRIPHDYDITTSALPTEMMQWFKEIGYLVIPTGLKHGTITLVHHGEEIEITTYRSECGYQNHRTPDEVTFTTSLLEDLKRRDFTMNAIAYSPIHGCIDPYHGFEDIKNQCIRCVDEPSLRFQEDALRILRAIRFACTLHFHIETKTWQSILNNAHDLRFVSAERKRDELNKLLLGEHKRTLHYLRKANILCELFPEYDQLYDHPQPTKWHCYDIFTHTDVALDHTTNYPLTSKLAIIFHDIGKIQCESFDEDGIAHYKGHAHVSMNLAYTYLKNLHYDNTTIQSVCTLIQYHDYYLHPKRSILRKFLSKFNNDLVFAFQALDVQIADNYGKNPVFATTLNENIEECKKLICTIEKEKDLCSKKDLCLNGNDLIEMGYHGKEIGILLDYLYELILENPKLNSKHSLKEAIVNHSIS